MKCRCSSRVVLRSAGMFVLSLVSACTDKEIVGYNCPAEGCAVSSPPQSPPVTATVRTDPAVTGQVFARCEDAAAGCPSVVDDAGCGPGCESEGCTGDSCSPLCDPQGCDAGEKAACAGADCCTIDLDCMGADDAMRCHPVQHRCVECWQDAQCSAQEPFCVNDECEACQEEGACQSDEQCDGECENGP